MQAAGISCVAGISAKTKFFFEKLLFGMGHLLQHMDLLTFLRYTYTVAWLVSLTLRSTVQCIDASQMAATRGELVRKQWRVTNLRGNRSMHELRT